MTENTKGRRPLRRLILTGIATVAMTMIFATSAMAEGGGTIAAASPIAYGQQEFGNTATGQHLESSCGFGTGAYRSYWALSVTAGDLVTVNWEGTPGTELKLMPIGTSDFTLFQTEPVVNQELSSNGKNQAQYTVPVTGVMPLYFRVCQYSGDAPGPYDFTVTAQHSLSVSLAPRPHVKPTSVIHGSAALASGGPVPDGMAFTLTASWPKGSAVSTALSTSGALAFQLALPEETEGQQVRLSLSRPADTQYLAPKAAEIETHVARPRVVTPPPVHHHSRHHHHHHHHRRRNHS